MSQMNLKLMQQLEICQHIAKLAHARLPVAGQLRKLAERSSSATSQAAQQVEAQLEAGAPLVKALVNDNSRNSRILAACIEAGEAANKLDVTLTAWTDMHIANARDSRMLRTSLLYPLLLISLTLWSLGWIVWKLVPEYRKTYEVFQLQLPGWLKTLSLARDHFWWLMFGLVVLIFAPLLMWAWRRRCFDKVGLPLEPSRRLRLQSLAAQLAGTMIERAQPLQKTIKLSMAATGVSTDLSNSAYEKVQQRHSLSSLSGETSMLLTSLHAGLIDLQTAVTNLRDLAVLLNQRADRIAQRHARWLPMLVAATVGLATILIYVLLIYMPWIEMLKQIGSPTKVIANE